VKRIKQLSSMGFQLAALVLAVRRFRDARRTGDRIEAADAIANAAVVVTGTVLLVRSLRRDDDE
jgi:hypothetical protein